ncbi:MAG: hypothetical protein GY705_13275, partial [Bacteroidetes bacterium]|nr:hypothetical protein [Bacteroidota bacterium]
LEKDLDQKSLEELRVILGNLYEETPEQYEKSLLIRQLNQEYFRRGIQPTEDFHKMSGEELRELLGKIKKGE